MNDTKETQLERFSFSPHSELEWRPSCALSHDWPIGTVVLSFQDRSFEASFSETSRRDLSAALESLEGTVKRCALENRFREMVKQWRAETRFLSNVTERSIHSAYQKIIGMGEAAIPYILQELKERGPDDWFWALTAITGENPITEGMAGNMAAMTEAWLAWGRKSGYLRD